MHGSKDMDVRWLIICCSLGRKKTEQAESELGWADRALFRKCVSRVGKRETEEAVST